MNNGTDRQDQPRYKRLRVRFFMMLSLLLSALLCASLYIQHKWQPMLPPIADAPLITDKAMFPIAGQIIYDSPNGKFWTLSLASETEPASLFQLPPRTFAFQPVWSAVNQQIAYGYIQPDPTTGKLTSAQLWIANLDGTNARQITKPPPDFQGTYRDPAWSPDGQSLWATVQFPYQDDEGVVRFQSQIRNIDIASGREMMIVPNAQSVAISPDGQSIAYLKKDSSSNLTTIWYGMADGSQARLLVSAEHFTEIYAPMRFSPDGQLLAFAAANSTNLQQRTMADETDLWSRFLYHMVNLSDRVYAHGLYPADVWLADLQSGQVTRLTQLSEDHPTPVWSPEGRYLAFAGILGLYLVDVVDHRGMRITEIGVDGQLEWIGKESD